MHLCDPGHMEQRSIPTRCLGCLAAQTLKDFEVVLVDNGSTDGSLDGLESRWPGLTLPCGEAGRKPGLCRRQ